jgi:hypothetical protein
MLGYEDPSSAGIDIVTAASGTDIHLLVALLLNHHDGRPLLTITLTGNETGSSVGKAASGRHYMSCAPSGAKVSSGSEINPGENIENVNIAVRNTDGSLRDENDVFDELDNLIARSQRRGQNCLLVATDVSKTGLIAPGLDTVFRLKARYADMLDILIDACQFRVATSTVREYLNRGLLVAVTGSKFLGGPIFSGALLCPPPLSRRLRLKRLPRGVDDYCAQADWPASWAMHEDSPSRINVGLLLRWHAALFELRAFLSCPDDALFKVADSFARAITNRLELDPAFAPLPSRPLERGALMGLPSAATSFDLIPTIFPFCLVRSARGHGPAKLLSAIETRLVYEALASGSGSQQCVRLGQPISFGSEGGGFSALRLCLSARLITQACASEAALNDLIAMGMDALDATAHWSAAIASSSHRAAA